MHLLTISKLAKAHGLSRSALLHYESLGLLNPSGHRRGNYRYYSESDSQRLAAICNYRSSGLRLDEIRRLLDTQSARRAEIEVELRTVSRAAHCIREQVELLEQLHPSWGQLESAAPLTIKTWEGLLAARGFTPAMVEDWHARFERAGEERHAALLAHLGFSPEHAANIRARAREHAGLLFERLM